MEALSRGAALVVSVEAHAPTADIARKNFQLVKGASGRFEVITEDVEKFIAITLHKDFDIIFIDSPYEVSNQVIEKILNQIIQNKLLKTHGVIAVERESRSKEFNWPSPLSSVKVRSYGQGSIYYGGYSASVSP